MAARRGCLPPGGVDPAGQSGRRGAARRSAPEPTPSATSREAIVFNRLEGIKVQVIPWIREAHHPGRPRTNQFRGEHLREQGSPDAPARGFDTSEYLMERPIIYDVRTRSNLVESTSGSRDLQMVTFSCLDPSSPSTGVNWSSCSYTTHARETTNYVQDGRTKMRECRLQSFMKHSKMWLPNTMPVS